MFCIALDYENKIQSDSGKNKGAGYWKPDTGCLILDA
jgi:hypothetical protein